jgi:anti-sigma regulatory factor (Ser/Thr protein kinase)
MVRMHLFDYLDLQPPIEITEHEEAGRFIPLTRVNTSIDLNNIITDLIPLLHTSEAVVDPIKYVVSELVRNVLEHAASPIGAIVCAQYYPRSGRLSVAVGDCGRGMLVSMRQSHAVTDYKSALSLALRPGITGVTSRIGGNISNAGAGLFFTKSIASLSRRHFVIYSGDCLYKLLPTPSRRAIALAADPAKDPHRFVEALPRWQGTVVGIDLSINEGAGFADLLDKIRAAYQIGKGRTKKDYTKRIRFS